MEVIHVGYMFTKEKELHVGCSDTASDFLYDLMRKAIIPTLRKHERVKENHCNTDGLLNVAMILQDCFRLDCIDGCVKEYLEGFVARFEKWIEQQKNSEWDNTKNKIEHLRAYNKILSNLKKAIE